MVRTRATCAKVGGGRSSGSGKKGKGGASSKASSSSSASSSSKIALSRSSSNSSIGGNPVCPRETPAWQKPITNFFKKDCIEEDNGTEEETGLEGREDELYSSSVLDDSENMNEYENDKGSTESDNSQEAGTEDSEIQSDSGDKSEENPEYTKENRDVVQQIGTPACLTTSEENPEYTEENRDVVQQIGTPACLTTPPSERKRRGNHINILTPKRIKGQY